MFFRKIFIYSMKSQKNLSPPPPIQTLVGTYLYADRNLNVVKRKYLEKRIFNIHSICI